MVNLLNLLKVSARRSPVNDKLTSRVYPQQLVVRFGVCV